MIERRRSFWNLVKNRTFVSDANARWCQNDKIELSNQNQSQHCIMKCISCLFFVINKKFQRLKVWLHLVLWFTSFADSLLWYKLFRPKKVRIILLGGKNYLWLLHFCQQKIESEAISDFIIYLQIIVWFTSMHSGSRIMNGQWLRVERVRF